MATETNSRLGETDVRKRININRPAYNEENFQQIYRETKENDSIPQRIKEKISNCSCTKKDVKNVVTGFFPVLKWLPEYDVRKQLLGDVISGFTVGILRLPQGMAYGILATLAPVYGLYTVFFPALLYSMMGTCMHLSIGSFAVVSIMTGTAVEKGIKFAYEEAAANNATINEEVERARIASTVALLVGLIQVCLAVLRLGFISTYLALPLVRGFTTGAACYVFNSQFKSLFGIETQRYEGPFSIVRGLIELFSNLHNTNPVCLLISLSCIVCLVIVKEVQDRFLKKVKYPIPIELIVIIVGTACSYGAKFESRYDVATVGSIPTGLPAPVMPPTKYINIVFADALTISIVTFSVAVSMGFIFAKRNAYEIDPNQELYALGASNVFCAFFQCYPAASSLSRSILQESAGGTTQIAGTLSCMFILLVLLLMGPLFEPLPKSVLAAIVVVALRGMFRQFKDVKEHWRYSKVDCLIWLVTFFSVVLLGVDYGLIVGVAFSIYTVIVRTQHPKYSVMGQIKDTDIYRDMQYYQMAEEIPNVKIFRTQSPMYYANAEYIKDTLCDMVGIHPLKVCVARAKAKKRQEKSIQKTQQESMKRKQEGSKKKKDKKWNKFTDNEDETQAALKPKSTNSLKSIRRNSGKNNGSASNGKKRSSKNYDVLVEMDTLNTINTSESSPNNTLSKLAINGTEESQNNSSSNHLAAATKVQHQNGKVVIATDSVVNKKTDVPIHTLILDMGGVGFVDIVGINTIKSIIVDFQKIGVKVLLAQCRDNIKHMIYESGCMDVVGLDLMYLTVHDAVLHAETRQLVDNISAADSAESLEPQEDEQNAPDNISINNTTGINNSNGFNNSISLNNSVSVC